LKMDCSEYCSGWLLFASESRYSGSLLRCAGKLFRHLETGENVHHCILAGVNVPGRHGNRGMPRDPRQSPGIAARSTQPG